MNLPDLKTKVCSATGRKLYSYGGGIWMSTPEAAADVYPKLWSTQMKEKTK